MAHCRAEQGGEVYRPRTDARRRRVAVLMCGCVRGREQGRAERREGDKGLPGCLLGMWKISASDARDVQSGS